jgi:hypothetical protein
MKKRTDKPRKRKSKQPQSPKRKKSEKSIDRIEASVKYIKGLRGQVPLDQAIKDANALYMKHGGTDNLKEAAYSFKKTIKVMSLLNLLKIEDNQIAKVK